MQHFLKRTCSQGNYTMFCWEFVEYKQVFQNSCKENKIFFTDFVLSQRVKFLLYHDLFNSLILYTCNLKKCFSEGTDAETYIHTYKVKQSLALTPLLEESPSMNCSGSVSPMHSTSKCSAVIALQLSSRPNPLNSTALSSASSQIEGGTSHSAMSRVCLSTSVTGVVGGKHLTELERSSKYSGSVVCEPPSHKLPSWYQRRKTHVFNAPWLEPADPVLVEGTPSVATPLNHVP